VLWTNLSLEELARRMADLGTPVCPKTIKQFLDLHDMGHRQAFKYVSMGENKDRNAQFENIAGLKQSFLASPNPIISMDTKKRELLGLFYRDGKLYIQETLRVYDHDFPSFGCGVVIPHGLYDLKRNLGYLNLGTSHDTSEFACDSLYQWWQADGRLAYPHARSLLLLCDGGGSNSARQYLFKQDLQKVADLMRLEIRVAHYPPYTSKYNPIDHRLFAHVSRACQGVIFTQVEQVKYYMEKAHTSTGLKVVVNILDKVYKTGRRIAEGFKKTMRIVFDPLLPKWNYRAVPAAN